MTVFRTMIVLAALAIAGPMTIGLSPVEAADTEFLGQVEDLPLAPGLAEDAGGFTFDKPDGRIVEAYAVGRVTGAQVMRFYRDALPQLGWREVGGAAAASGAGAGIAAFTRGTERLTIDTAEQSSGRLVVHFVLAPAEGAARP
ncbi:hypothetical protein [Tistrella mobilis]|uniref:Uncharacterized protein n=1 Tax=Tistrella mobilis (strain KA081020-065) TaxID=1110502 RepID=I3TRL2_TISMK|nr:hypothetical protein [Tistrella mobilis]AFK55400.1 hypothetical protein TMO_3562 [Tistrella mobilis KA081020-065]MAM73122.1 hypothetical protein [Tistrella sp.]